MNLVPLPLPRGYMAAASEFHLFNLPADPKAADGLYETEVMDARKPEQAPKASRQMMVLTGHHLAGLNNGRQSAAPA